MGREQYFSGRPIVITSCSASKRVLAAPLRLAIDPLPDSLDQLARNWIDQASAATKTIAAEQLYRGRAFSEARKASAHAKASLYVVSAGFGLITASTALPSYDVTVGAANGNLRTALAALNATPSDWWDAVNAVSRRLYAISTLIDSNPESVVMLALPSTYLSLAKRDLDSIADEALPRVRLMTASTGRALLSKRLDGCVLPYDERLDAIAGFGGTRGDFPQRALRHFVELLDGHRLSMNAAKEAVESALASYDKPARPVRQKLGDAELLALLAKHWPVVSNSSGRALRFIRDELQVACESSRLKLLWQEVKDKSGTCENGHDESTN